MRNQKDQPRLIEVAFPLRQASLASVHEKNVRHGHISTLHIWPARRPLATCRAMPSALCPLLSVICHLSSVVCPLLFPLTYQKVKSSLILHLGGLFHL